MPFWALLLFRVFWGFAGSRTARFGAVPERAVRDPGLSLPAPTTILRTVTIPLGGWSVAALLIVLLAITAAGLFAVDVDGLESGPLADWVSFDSGRVAAEWHERVFKIALAVIGLHVLAIAYYQNPQRP